MIDLLAHEDRSGFGIATALDVTGVPYRRITRACDFSGRALVVVGAASAADAALAARVPTVTFGAAPASVRSLFGVDGGRIVDGPARIALSDPVWPATVVTCARRFNKDALRLPWAPVFVPARRPAGRIVAEAFDKEGRVQPAVVQRGRTFWCLVDLGAALASLLDESYRGPESGSGATRPCRAAYGLYYRLPEPVRGLLQRRVYARLRRKLARDAQSSEYPVDATGWLLVELVTALVSAAAGRLVRLAPWPAPYGAAAALTHDVEPTRFAYRGGLATLGERIAASGHPATIGLVARAARRHLRHAGVESMRRAEVLCHGLEHRGETLAGSRAEIAVRLTAAQTELERALGRRLHGFRSPRLDRSRDLLWALDQAGFAYDSSYPDVDRETTSRFGAGVRLNIPFRPPIDGEAGRVQPSGCLELPVAAPDCIQPLFAGDDVPTLRAAVAAKIAFVCATGGLYVGIVHAGVFGRADAARRGEHLDFVARQLRRPEVWLASAGDVARWWRQREGLRLCVLADRVEVTNGGEHTVEGARLLVGDGEQPIDVPVLPPGRQVSVPLGIRRAGLPGRGRSANGQSPAPRVGVIGGGIAGLAAAHFLLAAGCVPVVIEASNQLGGLGTDFEHEGVSLDRFYHVILESDADLLAIVAELGMTDQLIWRETGMGFLVDGQLYGFNTPADLLRFGALGFGDRLRTGLGALYLTRAPGDGRDLDDVPAREWLCRIFGPRVFARLWEPLLRAKFGDHADALPAYWVRYMLRREKNGSPEVKGYVRGGFRRLAERLRESIVGRGGEVWLDAPVASIEPAAGGLRVDAGGREARFGAVISTLPLPLLARVVRGDLAPAVPLPDLRYQGVVVVLVVARRPLERFYWTAIVDPAFAFQGVVETTHVIPPAWVGGRHLIYLMNYCAAESADFRRPDDVLKREALEGLSALYPGFDAADVETVYVFRAPHVEPAWTVGYLRRRPTPRVRATKLYVCTTAQAYPRVTAWNTSVGLARETVDALVGDLR